MRLSSQKIYRGIVERFCREHGDKRVALLGREHIVRLMAGHADQPNVANALRRVLRAMMRHATSAVAILHRNAFTASPIASPRKFEMTIPGVAGAVASAPLPAMDFRMDFP